LYIASITVRRKTQQIVRIALWIEESS
jgi:hypothetical protein